MRPRTFRRCALPLPALLACALAGPARAEAAPADPGCSSCHAAEDPARAPAGATAAHRELACLSCHESHAEGAPSPFAHARVEPGQADARFDEETRLCVSCHFPEGQFRGRGGGIVQHPVGVPAARHDRHVLEPAAATTAAAQASQAVPAPDCPGDDVALPLFAADGAPAQGVIGCGTCHSLHRSPNAYQLRWAQAQEVAACSGCHLEAITPLATEH